LGLKILWRAIDPQATGGREKDELKETREDRNFTSKTRFKKGCSPGHVLGRLGDAVQGVFTIADHEHSVTKSATKQQWREKSDEGGDQNDKAE